MEASKAHFWRSHGFASNEFLNLLTIRKLLSIYSPVATSNFCRRFCWLNISLVGFSLIANGSLTVVILFTVAGCCSSTFSRPEFVVLFITLLLMISLFVALCNGCLMEKRLNDFLKFIGRSALFGGLDFSGWCRSKSWKFCVVREMDRIGWAFSSEAPLDRLILLCAWRRENFLIFNVSLINCNCFFHDDRFGVVTVVVAAVEAVDRPRWWLSPSWNDFEWWGETLPIGRNSRSRTHSHTRMTRSKTRPERQDNLRKERNKVYLRRRTKCLLSMHDSLQVRCSQHIFHLHAHQIEVKKKD